MKAVKLTAQERDILKKLSSEELVFFNKLSKDKGFTTFHNLTNMLIDQEKNLFYGSSLSDPMKIKDDLLFSRGAVQMMAKLIHIIVAAENEMLKRKEE